MVMFPNNNNVVSICNKLMVILLFLHSIESSNQAHSLHQNITDLINEVTPNFFPETLNAELDPDMTLLDVYDGNAGYMLVPSNTVLIVALSAALLKLLMK